jgi:hypothetical protein
MSYNVGDRVIFRTKHWKDALGRPMEDCNYLDGSTGIVDSIREDGVYICTIDGTWSFIHRKPDLIAMREGDLEPYKETVSELLEMLGEAEKRVRDAHADYHEKLQDINDQRRELAYDHADTVRDLEEEIADLKRRIREHSPLSGETDPISSDSPLERPLRERDPS